MTDSKQIRQIYQFRLDDTSKFGQAKGFELIYRGTEDGFKAKDFHGKCDNQGKTFGILKTETRDRGQVKISGWYTDIHWK